MRDCRASHPPLYSLLCSQGIAQQRRGFVGGAFATRALTGGSGVSALRTLRYIHSFARRESPSNGGASFVVRFMIERRLRHTSTRGSVTPRRTSNRRFTGDCIHSSLLRRGIRLRTPAPLLGQPPVIAFAAGSFGVLENRIFEIFSQTPRLPIAKATVKVTLVYIPVLSVGGERASIYSSLGSFILPLLVIRG